MDGSLLIESGEAKILEREKERKKKKKGETVLYSDIIWTRHQRPHWPRLEFIPDVLLYFFLSLSLSLSLFFFFAISFLRDWRPSTFIMLLQRQNNAFIGPLSSRSTCYTRFIRPLLSRTFDWKPFKNGSVSWKLLLV